MVIVEAASIPVTKLSCLLSIARYKTQEVLLFLVCKAEIKKTGQLKRLNVWFTSRAASGSYVQYASGSWGNPFVHATES